jgi:GTP-binding protein
MPPQVVNAEFWCGSPSFELIPHHNTRELALIGRSNVGKSTFINNFAARRKLARTSNTPGRTQECNLFEIKYKFPDKKDPAAIILADMPGYGYAKFAKSKRRIVSKLIEDYLLKREELSLVGLLIDCRREPEEEELWVKEVCESRNIPLLLIITKLDKLGKNDCQKRIIKLQKLLNTGEDNFLASSSSITSSDILAKILVLL